MEIRPKAKKKYICGSGGKQVHCLCATYSQKSISSPSFHIIRRETDLIGLSFYCCKQANKSTKGIERDDYKQPTEYLLNILLLIFSISHLPPLHKKENRRAFRRDK
jgi:hypothetical protein